MGHSRREFLKTASAVAITLASRQIAVPEPVAGQVAPPGVLPGIDVYPHAGESDLRELAARALEAAKTAGATYADVRFSLNRLEDIRLFAPTSYSHFRDYEF